MAAFMIYRRLQNLIMVINLMISTIFIQGRSITLNLKVEDRRFMKNIVFALLLGFTLFPMAGCSKGSAPVDEYLKNQLKNKKSSYQTAVNKVLFNGFYRLEIMSDGELIAIPESVDIASLIGLKELIQDDLNVNLINVDISNDSNDLIEEVAFFNYRRGFVFAGEHKGLVYVVNDSDIQPVDQLDNIDKSDVELHGQRLYKYIEPHWYIFYEYFP